MNPLVELRVADEFQHLAGLTQNDAPVTRIPGDSRRIVIPDVRGESSHEHQRALHKFIDTLPVRLDAAGNIARDSPAGRYLVEHGVKAVDFNSYGSRRGNHEVMVRGTFANIRLRNLLVPGVEGGYTRYLPDGEQMTIYDAAIRYQDNGTPLIVIAGAEYGTGSSRDWAAKGVALLGVRAVIAASYERIHRSNLVGMGILPLQFADGDSVASLGLAGTERYTIRGLDDGAADSVEVTATPDSAAPIRFEARVRIDTPREREYFRHGGILHYVLRGLAASSRVARS